MSAERPTTVTLVRHGESVLNAKGGIGGQLEPNPLTSVGKVQAELLAEKFSSKKLAAIGSSKLIRSVGTADSIAVHHPHAERFADPDFNERYWANLQGQHHTIVDQLLLNPDPTLLNEIETDEQVLVRFQRGIKNVAERYKEQEVIVVSHANVMRTFLIAQGYASKDTLPRGSLKNTGLITLHVVRNKIHIEEVEGITKKA